MQHKDPATVPRVAHIVIKLDYGGLEQCVLSWYKTRNQLYPQSTIIICLDDYGPLAKEIDQNNIFALHANRARFPWDTQALKRLRQIIQSENIAILHAHNTAARQYAALASRGIKHLYTDHATNIHLHGIINKIRLIYMRRHTDIYTTVSEISAKQLAVAENIEEETIHTIPNGVTPEKCGRCRKENRQRFDISDNETVIGFVGRLSPEKGVNRLISCFAKVHNADRLLIVGDGPQRDALETQARQLNVFQKTIFAGECENARSLLTAMDLFVLPSHSEGLPIALLEAMAEEIPVATTRVGNCPQVLDNGKYGTLLSNDETEWPAQLTHAIAHAKNDTTRKTVKDAHQWIAKNYSVASTVEKYEKRYRMLTSRETKGTPSC